MTEVSLQKRLEADFHNVLDNELKRKDKIFLQQLFASAHIYLVADIANFDKNVRVLQVAINAARENGDEDALNGILSCLDRTCLVLKSPARAERDEQSSGGCPGDLTHVEQHLLESQSAVHRRTIANRQLYERCLAVLDPIRQKLREFLMSDRGAEK